MIQRADLEAFSRAVNNHNGVKEIFAIAKDIDNAFGYGDGQTLYRAISSELGGGEPSSQKLPLVGGTRKAGALAGVSARLVAHFKRICVGLEARLAWRQFKHGHFTLESLAETSRRLREVSFVVLLLVFQDVCRPISERILAVQTTVEPWLVRRADEKLLTCVDQMLAGVEQVERLLSLCCLLAQWSHPPDRGRFFFARSVYLMFLSVDCKFSRARI